MEGEVRSRRKGRAREGGREGGRKGGTKGGSCKCEYARNAVKIGEKR